MNILDSRVRLIDALSGWGLREVRKYPGLEIPSDQSQRIMLGMEVVLRHVPELIARILLAEPLGVAEQYGVLRVDFGPEENGKLRLHDGATVAEAIPRLDPGHLQKLIEAPDPTPLVCTVQIDAPDHLVLPIVVYDGWHRAGAWFTRVGQGCPDRLIADLIKTKHPLVRPSPAYFRPG